jgi:hypothetical protein
MSHKNSDFQTLWNLRISALEKKQNLHTKLFAKNKLVESTDHEAGLSDATSTEV